MGLSVGRLNAPGWAAVLLLLVLGPPVPGAAQTLVSGDVYLLTQGGEVRQGAANRVYFIQRDPALAATWERMCASQSIEFNELLRRRDEVEDGLIAAADDPANAATRRELLELAIAHVEETLELMGALIQEQAQTRGDMLRDSAAESAPTGMNAHYSISLEPNNYWVFAEMQLVDQSNWWLLPLDIESQESLALDLDNNNLLGRGLASCDNNPLMP